MNPPDFQSFRPEAVVHSVAELQTWLWNQRLTMMDNTASQMQWVKLCSSADLVNSGDAVALM